MLKFFLVKIDLNVFYFFNKCLKDVICFLNICNLWYFSKYLNQGLFVSFFLDICKVVDCKCYIVNCLREMVIYVGFEQRDIMYFFRYDYDIFVKSYNCEIFESVSVILYFMVENMGRVENDNVDGLYEFM